MLWAVPFAAALCLGAFYAIRYGARAERCTMAVLVVVWVQTVAANIMTGLAAPIVHYVTFDIMAALMLFVSQSGVHGRNWQWIPVALFGAMCVAHFAFWREGHAGGSPSPFVYQSLLALFGYMQIASVIWASREAERVRRGANLGRLSNWAVSTSWVYRGSLARASDARA